MRVVFLGTPEFALPSLRALAASSYEVCAVYTQPDRPAGRGQKLHSSPVKRYAQSLSIPVFQPAKIRDEGNRALLSELRPDFIVVVAYGQILPEWLLSLPRVAPVNVHGSLLPRYRGAAPMAWALLNGDNVTGVTTMLIEKRLDTGPILLRREVPIPAEITTGELSARLAEIGAELLISTLDSLRDGRLTPTPQDDSQSTPAPRISKDMARISWERTAEGIHNLIRALNPWPLACAHFRGKPIQILRSVPAATEADRTSAPGTFLRMTEQGLRVQCGGGTVLEILEVQSPGKNRVSGREFANGARLQPGMPLFSSLPS